MVLPHACNANDQQDAYRCRGIPAQYSGAARLVPLLVISPELLPEFWVSVDAPACFALREPLLQEDPEHVPGVNALALMANLSRMLRRGVSMLHFRLFEPMLAQPGSSELLCTANPRCMPRILRPATDQEKKTAVLHKAL